MGLLEFFAAFDLVTPVVGIAKDVVNSPSTSFVLAEGGWSGRAVQRLLKKRGVDSWGMMNTPGGIIFFVREGQANYARHIMQQNDVSVI